MHSNAKLKAKALLGLVNLVGVLALAPMTAVIIWRLLDEETFLLKNLPAYDGYRRRTRYRLVPHVW